MIAQVVAGEAVAPRQVVVVVVAAHARAHHYVQFVLVNLRVVAQRVVPLPVGLLVALVLGNGVARLVAHALLNVARCIGKPRLGSIVNGECRAEVQSPQRVDVDEIRRRQTRSRAVLLHVHRVERVVFVVVVLRQSLVINGQILWQIAGGRILVGPEVQQGVGTQSLVIDIICRDSIPCAGECSISTHLQPFLHVVFGIDASRVALLFGTPHDAL